MMTIIAADSGTKLKKTVDRTTTNMMSKLVQGFCYLYLHLAATCRDELIAVAQ
jgi:hypothetical protein